MPSQTALIQRVETWLPAAADRLIRVADQYHGLIPSCLDLEATAMLYQLPAGLPGQRMGDRAFPGSNLMHDHITLRAFEELSHLLDDNRWRDAAGRYLERFARHCAGTPTGLFPWGEHSFWNLADDAIGNSHLLQHLSESPTHDHLWQAPLWLWRQLWRIRPACVERFAEGLDRHFVSDERCEYIRHAPILGAPRPVAGHGRGAGACDFPRHSGFYLLDWSFAFLQTGREDFRRQIERMLDYWWTRRHASGAVYFESRGRETDNPYYKTLLLPQTLSLAASLYDSAALLGGVHPDLAAIARHRAGVYLEAYLQAGHDPAAGHYLKLVSTVGERRVQPQLLWNSVYGGHLVAADGLLCLACHRSVPNAEALRFAEAVGRSYLAAPMPDTPHLPARDPALVIELYLDLFDASGQRGWLDHAVALAERMMPRFCDAPLPRAASGADYYESQCLPGRLLHSLVKLWGHLEGLGLDADYTLR